MADAPSPSEPAASDPAASESSSGGRGRGWVRPLAYFLVGAVVAVAIFAVVDRRGGSGSDQAAPTTTGPTSTTAAPAVAAKVYRTIQPSLVLIQAELGGSDAGSESLGSGVIFNAQGQVMTAAHVIDQATSIEVTFADGTRTDAEVVTSTPERDIAVLQPEDSPRVIVPAVLGGGVRIGDDTYSVGNPLGLADSLTAGVVSGLDRSIGREDGGGDLTGLIQFDAAVNPGSSGGPLLNRQGQVVGIVTALANPSGQRFFVGIGFAVPITSAGGGARIPPS